METHGKTLMDTYARAQIGAVHPGGVDAVRDETVAETVDKLYKRLATQTHDEKIRYLTGMHAKLSRQGLVQ